MAADDPTMRLIRELDDPAKFKRVERVAVFKPHRRKFPDGTEVSVTADDLAEIAGNVNRAYERDGELVRLVIGHRKQRPDAPEEDQPTVVGYARQYKAELVDRPGGPQLRLTHTEYVRREYEAEAARHPGRSPEYDPRDKTITAVALLTRDPALALGTVGYAGRTTYQMGVEMADEAKKDDDKFTEDEEKQYARCAAYLRKKYAKLAAYMDDLGPGNGTEPEKIGYQKDPAVDAEIAKLKDDVAAERKARVEEQSKRLLDPIKDARKFDYAKELSTLVSLPDDKARGGHVSYILANYEKLPTDRGVTIRVADSGADPAGAADANDPTKAPADYDRVLTYMRQSPGMQYHEAAAKLTGQK